MSAPRTAALGRAARLLAQRPPLHNGGHCFVKLDDRTWWCCGCHRGVPRWALSEGYVTTLLGRWCPALFIALPRGRSS